MKTIWKYPLDVTDVQIIELPDKAEILTVGNQGGMICLWALVSPNTNPTCRTIEIIGTGNPVEDLPAEYASRKFIGTVSQSPFIWHVFERIEI